MSLKFPRHWDFHLKRDVSKIVRSQSMMAVDAKGSSTWLQPPNPLERPLKAGWLKKQRSIVKNWQQRYFVLKGQHLYYYKEEEDLKPQGSLQLQGCTIREVASGSDEAGKFIFEIIPGLSADQTRNGPDSFVLMANSQADMEEWVKLLRRVVGSPLGVVFGQQLGDTMMYEQRFGQHQVPILVEKCAEFIRKNGLMEEGVFRLPGQDNLVKKLRDAFDAGERPSFDQDTDVHTVASLLKLYLRELPEPVIPWSQYEGFLLCGQLLTSEEGKGHPQLVKQLAHLPQDNYNLLSYICRFLHEVQQSSDTNKMSVENLATVFGVNLIRPQMEDPVTIMRGTPQIQKVMTTMISDHEKLFPAAKDVRPPPPPSESSSKKAPVLRSSVGWDAVQRPSMAWKENRSLLQIVALKEASKNKNGLHILSYSWFYFQKDDLEASSSELSDGLAPSAEDKEEPQSRDALETRTARKRTQTLPNRKCFESFSSNRRNQNMDKTDIFSSNFWSSSSSSSSSMVQPSPNCPSGGHKRTLSHGISKLFGFTQASDSGSLRSLGQGPTREADNSSSGQLREEFGPCLQMNDSPRSKENGTTILELSFEEDNLYPEDPELLRKMIAELKQELMAQKNSHEEQIRSLEKENFEVWTKVVRLNKQIEEEKAKSAELESELQNLKHSREVNEENQHHEDLLKSTGQLPTRIEQRTECASQL
ncbi:rho GTPase-activating protein 25 [Protobothrops mucrosquamatus]|uniref:rho GTPase-activating protein 25 n=1 Tax=Protobothrops mucrosquamatus TaxID=103944 RepID=UPI000775DED0|nr:rho GTPase-activating protein 25 [Protobothrops mucrosquamatus]